MSDSDWVTIAVLGRTRGNRGEVTAIALSSNPDRYDLLDDVYLFGDGTRYEVESVWFHDRKLIFKFRGVDTISDAERLQGAEVRIPFAERLPPEEGAYYDSDLIGCRVVERGEVLGEVSAVEDGLLVVGDLLIPFAKAICKEIDVAAKHIEVELPEGLKELNAETQRHRERK